MVGSDFPMARTIASIQNSTRPLVALTAYSHPFARLLDESGVDMILVGDSLGMVEHGREDTVSVTLEEMIFHTRSVRRGVKSTLLISDLPYGTYKQAGQALAAAKALCKAGADAVKLEGGQEMEPVVTTITSAGIPVVGHLGMLPQRIREEKKYRVKGKDSQGAQALLDDAIALEKSGAFCVVLELVHPPTAKQITDTISIPTIGIGSGPDCGGQILVTYDLVGLTPWFKPGFVEPLASIGEDVIRAAREFARQVRGD